MSAFDQYRKEAWPHQFAATLHVPHLCGGVPANAKVAEGWLRSKLQDRDDLIREMIAEIMIEREMTADEAAAFVDKQQHVNGFKRNGHGLFIEGRQVKAAIKEGASVAVAAGKLDFRGWGKTNKGLQGFLAEHVVVLEDQVLLGTNEADGVDQRFIHKTLPGRGKISAIHYEEYVKDAELSFTVLTDFEFTDKQWAMIWLTGEQQGIGASRSQGYGRYTVTRWEKLA